MQGFQTALQHLRLCKFLNLGCSVVDAVTFIFVVALLRGDRENKSLNGNWRVKLFAVAGNQAVICDAVIGIMSWNFTVRSVAL